MVSMNSYCVRRPTSIKFVPTPGSTFSILILWNRKEIDVEDGYHSIHSELATK